MSHSLDRDFIAKVERALGTPESAQLTPSGRTVLYFSSARDEPAFTVFTYCGRPIAAKRVPDGMKFARVGAGGLGPWSRGIPGANAPHKPRGRHRALATA